MKVCPMCGKAFEGNASDILPGRELCAVCAENIHSFAKSQDEAERQEAHAYIRECRENTVDHDVRDAIDALLREHEAPSSADVFTPPVSTRATPLNQHGMQGNSGPKIILLVVAGANSRQGGAMVITGIIIAVVGSLVSWFVSLLARGFGEMVNNVHIQTELAVRNASRKE